MLGDVDAPRCSSTCVHGALCIYGRSLRGWRRGWSAPRSRPTRCASRGRRRRSCVLSMPVLSHSATGSSPDDAVRESARFLAQRRRRHVAPRAADGSRRRARLGSRRCSIWVDLQIRRACIVTQQLSFGLRAGADRRRLEEAARRRSSPTCCNTRRSCARAAARLAQRADHAAPSPRGCVSHATRLEYMNLFRGAVARRDMASVAPCWPLAALAAWYHDAAAALCASHLRRRVAAARPGAAHLLRVQEQARQRLAGCSARRRIENFAFTLRALFVDPRVPAPSPSRLSQALLRRAWSDAARGRHSAERRRRALFQSWYPRSCRALPLGPTSIAAGRLTLYSRRATWSAGSPASSSSRRLTLR